MPKAKFEVLESTCVPLPLENIDTDQIIPARFLSATTKEGFGKNLFRDWRYDEFNEVNPDFILNNPVYSGQVLVAGKNFGCGSSREHAVWAITDYGFRVVISSFFADIFRNNSLNIGLLPIVVTDSFLSELLELVTTKPETRVKVDLEKQTLTVLPTGKTSSFEINSYKKECMLKGLDDIDYLLGIREFITEYEVKNKSL